jgi:hypothetical protein
MRVVSGWTPTLGSTQTKEKIMYYMLAKKEKKTGHFSQLGIVVAESVEDAITKIQGVAINVVVPPESGVVCAELEGDYWLEKFEEVTSLPTTSEQ